MKNKRNCSENVIFSKYRCIKNIFTKNMGSSIVHFLVLMLPGCSCIGTAGAAAPYVDESAGCVCIQAEVGV